MMNKRIAVIGHHLATVTKLADFLGQLCTVKVYKDQNDEMYELLKVDTRKYFSAYQLHVLLNRSQYWSLRESCIVCDTLFTDYCATMAALESQIITKVEFDIYEAKQNECMEAFRGYDALIYLKPSDSMIDDPLTADFPLKYAALCQKHFDQKLKMLQDQLKDYFLCVSEQEIAEDDSMSLDLAKNLALRVFNDIAQYPKQPKAKENHDGNHDENTHKLHQIKEKLPYVSIVTSKDEIKTLIEEFQAEKVLSVRLPCLYMDEEGCCTCLRVMNDDDNDEWIECKEFADLDEIIAFLKEGVKL